MGGFRRTGDFLIVDRGCPPVSADFIDDDRDGWSKHEQNKTRCRADAE